MVNPFDKKDCCHIVIMIVSAVIITGSLWYVGSNLTVKQQPNQEKNNVVHPSNTREMKSKIQKTEKDDISHTEQREMIASETMASIAPLIAVITQWHIRLFDIPILLVVWITGIFFNRSSHHLVDKIYLHIEKG